MFSDEHMNSYTIFKRAQLFERFGALQRARFPFDETKQGWPAETVNALVTEKSGVLRLISWEGDYGAGEIEGMSAKIDNYLHLMRR